MKQGQREKSLRKKDFIHLLCNSCVPGNCDHHVDHKVHWIQIEYNILVPDHGIDETLSAL